MCILSLYSLFSKIVLTVLGSFSFRISFRVNLSIFTQQRAVILIGIAEINLGPNGIFTRLDFPILEYSMVFLLLRSSLICNTIFDYM